MSYRQGSGSYPDGGSQQRRAPEERYGRDPSRQPNRSQRSRDSDDFGQDVFSTNNISPRPDAGYFERDRDFHNRGSSRPGTSFNRSLRPERHPASPSSTSAASPTSQGPQATDKNPAAGIVHLLRRFSETVCELAPILSRKDALDKFARQKRAEYDKSLPKHAEYPSVPELQQKYRDKIERENALIAKDYKGVQEKLGRILDDLAQALLQVVSPTPVTQTQRSAAADVQTRKEQEEALHTAMRALEEKHQKQLDAQRKALIEEMDARIQMQAEEFQRKLSEWRSPVTEDDMARTREETAGLRRQVEELKEENMALRREMGTNQRKVEHVETQLSTVDFAILNQVSQSMSSQGLDLKNLHDKVVAMDSDAQLQKAKLAKMASTRSGTASPSEVRSQSANKAIREAVAELCNASHSHLATTFGNMIDELRRAGEQVKTRIHELEEAAKSQPNGGAELDVVKAKLEQAERDSISKAEQLGEVAVGVKDVERKLDATQVQLQTLDSQYNNLTTKGMAEVIVGHLDQLNPNYRQVLSDLEGLRSSNEDHHKLLGALQDTLVDLSYNVRVIQSKVGHFHSEADEDPSADRQQHRPKKRRLDQQNGTAPANGIEEG